jgi:uncharacterized coiled-coil protein SlyX
LNFNYDELNQRINQVETRLTTLEQDNTYIMGILDQTWDMITQINLSIMTLNNRVGAVEGSISNINTQLGNFSTQLTNLSNTINSMQTNINSILDLYKPISWFTYNQVRFTDSSGNTAYGSFHGAWYRPIKFLDVYSNEGVDLKFLMLVIREINISPLTAGVPYNSDPLVLPIGFVNNNDYRVFWSNTVTNHFMNTKQAEYFLYNVPINTWALNVLLHQGSSVNSDSAWFMIGYI